MANENRGAAGNALRLVILLTAYLWLSGCVSLPPMLNYASMALSGISYVATGKGPSDHALSFATHKDCTLMRIVLLKPICIDVTAETNQPVWVQLFKKRHNEYTAEVPKPPRLFVLPDVEVVQLNNPPATPN